MTRSSKQHPREPVGADSYIYVAEIDPTEIPDQLTAIPEWQPTGFYKAVLSAEKVLAGIIFTALFVFGLALAGLMFAQVLLRYVFHSPFVGIEEIALLFGVWTYFLGMAYVTRNGEHIHGGILTLVVKNPRAIQLVRIVMTVLSLIAAAVFAYYAIRYAMFEIDKNRMSSYMRWPRWLWSSSLIFGFGGMVLYLALQFVNQICVFRNPVLLAASQSKGSEQ
ncbi:TRAP transporter small permease [Thioclava sp. GXIMD4216]|uniref:TRAP transporter small permease protein n=1 Tax=Thioclava litoralis TaxID=3076557 RepID=A0ABZ1DWB4_9RHOB|nr:TRAP transporter small permease [Thioclava sp. FTW29]